MQSILDEFSLFSRLQVNDLKRHVIFSKRVHDANALVGILDSKSDHYLIGKYISNKDSASLIAD